MCADTTVNPDTRIMIEAGLQGRLRVTCSNCYINRLISFGNQAPYSLRLFPDVAFKPTQIDTANAAPRVRL